MYLDVSFDSTKLSRRLSRRQIYLGVNKGKVVMDHNLVGVKLYDSELEIRELVFDGDVRGIYAGVAVQELATDYGWKTWASDILATDFNESVSEATDYLNDKVAKDGKQFYWEDGSFWYGVEEDYGI